MNYSGLLKKRGTITNEVWLNLLTVTTTTIKQQQQQQFFLTPHVHLDQFETNHSSTKTHCQQIW